MMDESYWSNVDYLEASNLPLRPYFISKTLTEKRALEFAEEHGLDLVTLIPSYVLGPLHLSEHACFSSRITGDGSG
ncbi:hypothetical protein OIU77_025035 [Salix suchowensis]|uniref:NAD-dependent epimerase/dehydratase domain-containing protein n=1 Tax=Salix suchowensis TaxID=1278906 RepID=A0ABQ9BXP6_9ROSI|nr:hypothetical protein OIU77_025035 [Salix suchowensis]